MKKLFAVAVAAFFFTHASAQVSAMEAAQHPEKMTEHIDHTPYDSTVNFVGPQGQKYVGQTFYLPGKPAAQQSGGYLNFVRNYTFAGANSQENAANVYHSTGGDSTPYNVLVGKYFKVAGAYKHPQAPAAGPSIFNGTRYLKLVEKNSGDTLYFWYDGNKEASFPFITVGYWDKLKQLNTGHSFVFADSVVAHHKDIATGAKLAVATGGKWNCIDIQPDTISYKLACIFQNTSGQKMSISTDSVLGKHPPGVVYSAAEEHFYRRAWSESIFDTILHGLVGPGMNADMVKLAWGKPLSVDRKAATPVETTEIWQYDNGRSVTLFNFRVTAVTVPGAPKKTDTGK